MRSKADLKKTSIGYIPKDWSIVKLGDVADPMDPWSFTGGPFGSNLKSSDYTSTGVRVIQLQNIGDGVFHNDYKIFTSDIKANQLKSCNIYPGDIILSKMGDPVARACIIPKTHSRYLMCSDGIRLNINKSRYNAYFIYSKINSSNFRLKAESLSTGSTRKRINLSKLRNINLLLPPLKEQRAIAQILNDVDELMIALEKLIDKKKMIKKGMMQELLKPKKYWKEIKLKESASLKARIGWQGLTTSEYLTQGDCFLITGTDFDNGKIDFESCFYVERKRYDQDRNIQLNLDDILVTKDGTIGKVAIIKKLTKPATLNSGIFVIKAIGQSFYPKFLYYILKSYIFIDFLNKLSSGSTINHLYQKDFSNFSFFAPSLDNQKKTAQTLNDMDCEINALKVKLTKIKNIKKGMMQQLLTGRIRLI